MVCLHARSHNDIIWLASNTCSTHSFPCMQPAHTLKALCSPGSRRSTPGASVLYPAVAKPARRQAPAALAAWVRPAAPALPATPSPPRRLRESVTRPHSGPDQTPSRPQAGPAQRAGGIPGNVQACSASCNQPCMSVAPCSCMGSGPGTFAAECGSATCSTCSPGYTSPTLGSQQ